MGNKGNMGREGQMGPQVISYFDCAFLSETSYFLITETCW